MDNLEFLNNSSRESTRVDFFGGAYILSEKDGSFHKVEILDISASGIKITNQDEFLMDEKLHIMPVIFDDIKNDFEFECTVVRKDEFNGFCGLKILSSTFQTYMKLLSIIIKNNGDSSSIKKELILSQNKSIIFKDTGAPVHKYLESNDL